MGVLPVILAVFASVFVVASWRRRNAVTTPLCSWNSEIWFWLAAMALTLLLAFGKYFPLYQLFYQLPLVGSIRNPNKFLQIFQLALAILAAHGLNLAVCFRKSDVT